MLTGKGRDQHPYNLSIHVIINLGEEMGIIEQVTNLFLNLIAIIILRIKLHFTNKINKKKLKAIKNIPFKLGKCHYHYNMINEII